MVIAGLENIGGVILKKLFLIIGMIFVLSGCHSDLSFNDVSFKGVDRDLQKFIDFVKNENGVHLYADGKKSIYVYLNAGNVIQGENAEYFTNFDVQKDGEALNIVYKTAETSDYSNPSFKHELLYKVNLDKRYEYIKPIRNGEESFFGVVSGNE